MATLRVENIPDDLYGALRKQAKLRRTSIAQEVISLLEAHVHTRRELTRRRRLLQKALLLSARLAPPSAPSTEEMLREDRAR
jgi:Antitoxin FitA-like, ribbon-helix-helix